MKEKDISNNELARMVKTGFDELSEKMKTGFEKVDGRLTALENGQEEIKLRLTNVAYRFEVVKLENQVKSLTKKLKTLEWLVAKGGLKVRWVVVKYCDTRHCPYFRSSIFFISIKSSVVNLQK